MIRPGRLQGQETGVQLQLGRCVCVWGVAGGLFSFLPVFFAIGLHSHEACSPGTSTSLAFFFN